MNVRFGRLPSGPSKLRTSSKVHQRPASIFVQLRFPSTRCGGWSWKFGKAFQDACIAQIAKLVWANIRGSSERIVEAARPKLLLLSASTSLKSYSGPRIDSCNPHNNVNLSLFEPKQMHKLFSSAKIYKIIRLYFCSAAGALCPDKSVPCLRRNKITVNMFSLDHHNNPRLFSSKLSKHVAYFSRNIY